MRAPLALAAVVLAAAGLAVGAVLLLREPGEPAPGDAPRDEPRPARAEGDDGDDGDEPRDPEAPGTSGPKPRAAPFREPPLPPLPEDKVPGRDVRWRWGIFGEPATKVDWRRVGVAVRHARRDLVDAARRAEQGRLDTVELLPLSEEVTMRLVREAEPMVAATMHALLDEPGIGGPSRLLATPAFEANALAATLDAFGLPLSPEQERRVGELFEPQQRLSDATRPDPKAGVWNVDDLLTLTRARVQVQKELEALLSDDQRAALWPPLLAGRVRLDIFSPATLWRDRVLVADVPEEDDVALRYAESLNFALTLADASADVAPDAARAWLKTLPVDAKAKGVRGALSRGGFVTLAELLPFAEAWPALLREIEERAAARGGTYPRPPGERRIVVIARTTR